MSWKTRLLLSASLLMVSPVFAEQISNTQFSYAAPCEAVQPKSAWLQQIQAQLKTSSLAYDQTTTQVQQNILNDFWDKVATKTTPLIEPVDQEHSRIIFLWRGAHHNVRLIGGPSNDHDWLTRIPNSDIWFKEAIVSNQFMGSYRFAVDLPMLDDYLSYYCPHLNPTLKESRAQRRAVLQVQQLDPFNSKYLKSNLSSNQLVNENFVRLNQAPSYIDPNDFKDHPDPVLNTYTLNSKILNNQRTIQIYQSSNHANSNKDYKKQSYITLIFFDGQQYAQLLNVPKALDILVQQGKLPPIQAVFVSPASEQERPKELTPNAEFTQFFNHELLPWIDHHLPHQRDSQKTVLLGSSLGGLSSAYLALKNPQQLSHVVALSGSFWWQQHPTDQPNGMSQLIREQKNQPKQHWYISANQYESSRNNNELSILETSPIVAQDLKNRGHDVTYKNYVGGHSYAIWQMILQDALLHFFAE